MQKLTATEALERLENGNTVLIDLRDQAEYATAHIPGAVLLPAKHINSDAACRMPADAIFYCSSGMRTQASTSEIVGAGFKNVAMIEGGLEAWRNSGLPVVEATPTSSHMSLPRQVQLTVGVMLLILTALTIAVSPLYSIGAAAIGLGLAGAGLTGSCMLARILMMMPWNRPKRSERTTGVHAHG